MRPFPRNFGALEVGFTAGADLMVASNVISRADATDLRDWLDEWLEDKPSFPEPLAAEGRE